MIKESKEIVIKLGKHIMCPKSIKRFMVYVSDPHMRGMYKRLMIQAHNEQLEKKRQVAREKSE